MTKTRSTAAATGAASAAQADDKEVLRDFGSAVNMSPAQLERWLAEPDSRSVGFKGRAGGESVGHRSGRRIVRLLQKTREDLTRGDIAHMRKVVGYVHRHLAQRPDGNVRDTPWRHSLMNWGHDPLRKA